jgi:hypothetical protein
MCAVRRNYRNAVDNPFATERVAIETLKRNELIEQVRYGRMTPDEADAEAVRLGFGKLSYEPPDDAFDAMGETWWTLSMVVAWIALRTPKLVRSSDRSYQPFGEAVLPRRARGDGLVTDAHGAQSAGDECAVHRARPPPRLPPTA